MNKLKTWLKQLNAYANKHLQTWEIERKRWRTAVLKIWSLSCMVIFPAVPPSYLKP